jgi:anti-sigma B factor antagonist
MFDIKMENNEIHLTGRFNAAMVDRANEIFNQVNTSYIVNFEGLDYISSGGLSVLLRTQKRLMGSGHQLIIKNMNTLNREVFRLTGFDKIFKIEEE